METLNKLFKDFYRPSPQVDLNAEITQNHKELIETLSKADRRKVLKIIDNLMMITALQTEESFICGLRLGMKLTVELQNYNDHSLRENSLNDCGQFFMSEDKSL